MTQQVKPEKGWNVSHLSLSLTHRDEPLNMDHHSDNNCIHIQTQSSPLQILIWGLLQRSNPLDIIKALKPVGTLSFGMQDTIYFKQWNRITCLLWHRQTHHKKILHFIARCKLSSFKSPSSWIAFNVLKLVFFKF